MSTDSTEKGLESLIVKTMTGLTGDGLTPTNVIQKPATPYGGTGWLLGDPTDYDREYCVSKGVKYHILSYKSSLLSRFILDPILNR